MEEEPKIPDQEKLSDEKMYHQLGEALNDGDTETALTALHALEQSLLAKALDAAPAVTSDVTEQEPDNEPNAEAVPESIEEDLVRELFEKINLLKGTKIAIFGTGSGLTVPLSLTINGERTKAGDISTTPNQESFEGYERGRNKEMLQPGLKFFRKNGKKTVELVLASRDAFNRFGFKGIQIVFPLEDDNLADSLAADEATCEKVIRKIWSNLESSLPSRDKQFYTVD